MKKREFVRKLPALILAAGLLVSLAACSPPVSNLANCDPVFPSGDNSNAVRVSGDPGEQPSVDFPTPLVAKSSEQSVVVAGKGNPIYPGQSVKFLATMLDGETGEPIATTGYEADSAILANLNGGQLVPFLECSRVGERIAVVTDYQTVYQDTYDPASMPPADATVVLVYDIVAAYLGKANGWDQLPQAGFPSVVLSPNGQPGITVPGDDAPKDLKIATLKAGTGAAVKDDDNVVLQYTGVVWESGEVFDSSWSSESGAPTVLNPRQVVPGFAEAITGAKIGSQVIVVIPPGEKYGYAPGSEGAQTVGEGNTMIFVIDILGIQE